jgi:N-acetylmuramoyl-L-alanine amidase
VDYVDAAAFFARYGLRTTATAGDLRFTLQGGGNQLELVANERDITINGLRLLLGEPALVRARAILVSRADAERRLGPILSPAGIAAPAPPVPRIIVLDPGHGGQDSGTSTLVMGVFEKTFTLDVAERLKPILEAMGWQVVLTRTEDHFIPLPERPAMAVGAHADLFVSIHFNSVFPDTKTTGTEIYTLPTQFERSTRSWSVGEKDDSETQPDSSNRYDAWNAVLANDLHRALLSKLGTFDRGQTIAHYAVLKGLNCPGVLIESAFLSNDAEARKVATPAFRQQIAEGIASGLAAYAAQLTALRKP